MKVVLAVAVLALLAIGVNGTAQRLGMIPANALTLTSSDQTTATAFTITRIVTPTTYVADGSAFFDLTFNVTWTGYLPGLITDSKPSATVTFTGSGNVYQFDASCGPSGVYSAGGTRYGNFLTYETHISPRFLAAGTATATINVYWPPATVVATDSFTFTTTTPYSPPSGNRPTVSAFALAAAFSSVNVVAANVTLANTASGFYGVQLVFTAGNNNQGVAWVTSASTNTGVIGNEASSWSTLSPYLGSWCGDSFSGSPASGIDLPTGTNLMIRSVTVSNSAGATSYGPSASFLAGNNAIAVTSGETDVTPPTCAGAVFADPLDVATGTAPLAAKTLTLACDDGTSGSGLAYTGAFLRAAGAGITYDFPSNNFNLVNAVTIPLHYSGSINVIGVWSMDEAGNTVVYGSCGAVTTGAPESVCGEGGEGSSSSAVIASISVVITCILAVLAL